MAKLDSGFLRKRRSLDHREAHNGRDHTDEAPAQSRVGGPGAQLARTVLLLLMRLMNNVAVIHQLGPTHQAQRRCDICVSKIETRWSVRPDG